MEMYKEKLDDIQKKTNTVEEFIMECEKHVYIPHNTIFEYLRIYYKG